MSCSKDLSFGCDPLPHPPLPDIPAGLANLPMRQWAGFPEYREAMLSAIRSQPPLADWRARGAGDLGVMLLEAWSIVLDVTGFYDARIAERAYLATAPDQATARRLTALLGHHPRPAMAARVKLAVEAEGADPVELPRGTGFRSDPFNGEPPQVFELADKTVIWPQRNRWQLAPIREGTFDGALRFLPRRGPHAGAIVLITSEVDSSVSAAARVAAVETETAVDGAKYLRADLETSTAHGLDGLNGQPLSELTVALARLPLAERASTNESGPMETIATSSTGTDIVLESLYSQVRRNTRAVAEVDGEFYPVTIKTVTTVPVAAGPPVPTDNGDFQPTAFATKVNVEPQLPQLAVILHVNLLSLGSPTRSAKTSINAADIQSGGMMTPPVTTLGAAPSGGDVIVLGAKKRGVLVTGSFVEEGEGAARFVPDSVPDEFDGLAAPLSLFGNVVQAVRGETVIDEVLGSGNGARPFESFTLKKEPLAWVEDASLPDGCRPELTVRVDQIEWQRVDSFFGRRADEQIYVVRQDDEGAATIHFGDGRRGARLPTGVDNVRADYRYGAGSAKPPPGSINQIAVPVPGLASVRGPLPAVGGADAETSDELRVEAPRGALTLGRAVSVADFEALARTYPGVLNAAAGWGWDARRQRASVRLWIIADQGDPGDDLARWLAARAAIGLSISVELAERAPASTLSITLEIAERHDPLSVRSTARDALFNPRTGILASANVTIGKPLFRSELTHRLHHVAGVASVVSILLDGALMPNGVSPGSGRWFDLEAGTIVS